MVSVLCEYYVSFERATRFLLSRPQQYTDIVSNQCGSWCVFQGCLQCTTIHPGNTLICYLSCVNIMCFQGCHQRTSIHTDGGSHLCGLEPTDRRCFQYCGPGRIWRTHPQPELEFGAPLPNFLPDRFSQYLPFRENGFVCSQIVFTCGFATEFCYFQNKTQF